MRIAAPIAAAAVGLATIASIGASPVAADTTDAPPLTVVDLSVTPGSGHGVSPALERGEILVAVGRTTRRGVTMACVSRRCDFEAKPRAKRGKRTFYAVVTRDGEVRGLTKFNVWVRR